MTAAAFDGGIHALVIYLLVAVLAHLVSRFLETVYIRVAYLLIVADTTFVNHHGLILGMMAGGARICLLMLAMREMSRFAPLSGLKRYFGGAYAYLDPYSIPRDKK